MKKELSRLDTCKVVSDLLKNYHCYEIPKDELEKQLKKIKKSDLFELLYFTDLQKEDYRNLYESTKKSKTILINNQL